MLYMCILIYRTILYRIAKSTFSRRTEDFLFLGNAPSLTSSTKHIHIFMTVYLYKCICENKYRCVI